MSRSVRTEKSSYYFTENTNLVIYEDDSANSAFENVCTQDPTSKSPQANFLSLYFVFSRLIEIFWYRLRIYRLSNMSYVRGLEL